MQNEFEKQVQQKMEELKLVPSDPVWQKVEMQIRKKKDRRRAILWIPLIVLLAGGLWIGIEQYPNNENRQSKIEHLKKENPVVVTTSTPGIVEENRPTPMDKTPLHFEKKIKAKPTGLNLSPAGNVFEQLNTANKISFVEKKNASPSIKEPVIVENIIQQDNQLPRQVNVDTSLKTIPNYDTIATSNKVEQNATAAPVKQDSTVVKKPEVKKHALRKWKYNLLAVAGLSGLGRINMYNGQKSLSAYNAPPAGANGGGQFNYGPSEVAKGFSYAIGALANKQLGKKTLFSVGLQYNYYSNTIEVGSNVNQSRVIMDYAVTQFYSNQTNAREPYRNHYHFITIPVVFDWQLLKKYPLNFNTGLSLQYLLQTNALRFDYATQAYFHNIKAFNRAQLMSELGLSYSVPLKQKPLTFGPQLQYGLTRLEKGNVDHHLFSYGLKVQWQLSKN